MMHFAYAQDDDVVVPLIIWDSFVFGAAALGVVVVLLATGLLTEALFTGRCCCFLPPRPALPESRLGSPVRLPSFSDRTADSLLLLSEPNEPFSLTSFSVKHAV